MNLIWICSDTFRNDHLGCMGNARVKTPNLDRLASDSLLFEGTWGQPVFFVRPSPSLLYLSLALALET